MLDQSTTVPITDCSRLDFHVNIRDETIFKHVKIMPPEASKDDASCTVLALDALKVGRTKIKITVSQLQSNELTISSFSPLNSIKNELGLAKDSDILVSLFDGPMLQQHGLNTSGADLLGIYASRTQVSDDKVVDVRLIESLNKFSNSYRVKCKEIKYEKVIVKFSISNKKTAFNKCPVQFDHEISVKCARPHSLIC